MAARLNLRQQEQTRAAIQTTQLVKRLQDFALGQEGVEIDTGRLKAIEVLLRKALPDLSAVSIGGDDENPVNVLHRIERVIVDPANPDRAGL
jgi:hypothetical protein